MRTVTIELAGAPRGKERPRFVKATGRTFTAPKTVKFESELKAAAERAMAGRPPFEGALHVDMFAYMVIPTSKTKKWKAGALDGSIRPTVKPDFDNIAKMLDGLNQVVWIDDKQIVDFAISKAYSVRPRVKLVVTEIGGNNGSVFD